MVRKVRQEESKTHVVVTDLKDDYDVIITRSCDLVNHNFLSGSYQIKAIKVYNYRISTLL